MGERAFTIKPHPAIPSCPKCGNETNFTARSAQVAEDCCDVWVTCRCGFDATAERTGSRVEDVWGSLGPPQHRRSPAMDVDRLAARKGTNTMTADTLERIEQEMREELDGSRYVIEVSVEAFKSWTDRLAAMRQQQGQEWVRVPREAESEMMNAGVRAAQKAQPNWEGKVGHMQVRAAWDAMIRLAAAPEEW